MEFFYPVSGVLRLYAINFAQPRLFDNKFYQIRKDELNNLIIIVRLSATDVWCK